MLLLPLLVEGPHYENFAERRHGKVKNAEIDGSGGRGGWRGKGQFYLRKPMASQQYQTLVNKY